MRGSDELHVFDLESYTLNEPREFECEDCGAVDEITSIGKAGRTFRGIQVGKESGSAGWMPTDRSWVCPGCSTDE